MKALPPRNGIHSPLMNSSRFFIYLFFFFLTIKLPASHFIHRQHAAWSAYFFLFQRKNKQNIITL